MTQTLREGNLLWLGLASLLQLSWLGNIVLIYQAIYRLLGMPRTLWQLLPLAVTSNLINTAALFVEGARRA